MSIKDVSIAHNVELWEQVDDPNVAYVRIDAHDPEMGAMGLDGIWYQVQAGPIFGWIMLEDHDRLLKLEQERFEARHGVVQ